MKMSLFVTTVTSQGSVATDLKCGGNVTMTLLQIYCQIQQWKKNWKSVNICQSYGQKNRGPFFDSQFSIFGQFEITVCFAWLLIYWASKISSLWPWPYGFTWRHWSRDIGLDVYGGQFKPTIYFAQFPRCRSSKISGNLIVGHVTIGITTYSFLSIVLLKHFRLFRTISELWSLKDFLVMSWPWIFGVTWCHQSQVKSSSL